MEFLRFLRGHPRLKAFVLKRVSVKESTITLDALISGILVSVPNLEYVCIQDCTELTISGVAGVSYAKSLKKLRLVNNGVKQETLERLADAVVKSKSIEQIEVMGEGLCDVGRQSFAGLIQQKLGKSSTRSVKVLGDAEWEFPEFERASARAA